MTDPTTPDEAVTGRDQPDGVAAPDRAEGVPAASTTGSEAAEPPPADFDPAQQPSNPDLVKDTEPPD